MKEEILKIMDMNKKGTISDAIKDVKGAFNKNGVNGLSKTALPTGHGYIFEVNKFNVSNVSGQELNDCQMYDNKFQASNVTGLRINGGHM